MRETLFHFSLRPKDGAEALYYRTDGFYPDSGHLVSKHTGATVFFDTYFHLIPVSKLKRYCDVNVVGFAITAVGKYKAEIFASDGEKEWRLDSQSNGLQIALSAVPEEAVYLYLKITALAAEVTIEKICAYAECARAQEVNLAIVLCTYRREQEAERNAKALAACLRERSLAGRVIVVDNGRTLEDFGNDKIVLLPNENTGGSGGFARGMAYAAERDFTHILLMDDDVALDCISIEKVYSFLRIAKEKDLSIAGTMLYRDKPTVCFESGGYFDVTDGNQKGMCHFLDFAEPKALAENEREKEINYGGWWMACMPSKYAKEGKLPLPFFLKYDDVEYALRCGQRFLTLSGVGVWHEKHESKYNSEYEYYNIRNYLHLCSLHCKGFTEKRARKLAAKRYKAKQKRQQYQMAQAVMRGYKDYLKGMEWLEDLDHEANHKEICKLNYKFISYDAIKENFGFRPKDDTFYAPPEKRKIILALIPKQYIITDHFDDHPLQYLFAKYAIHCDADRNLGYVTERQNRDREIWRLK